MFRLSVTLLTLTLALFAQAGTCPVKPSGSNGRSGSGSSSGSGDKGTYPTTTDTGTYTAASTTWSKSSDGSGSGSSNGSTSTGSTGDFTYGIDKVRGTNTGGWFVLESWITPSLFKATGNDAIIDEWTFGELQDNETALAALTQHWETWYTEQDFKDMAAAGLNHVRIPIGYWAFDVQDGEPYIQGQLPYLQKALSWADNAGLKVIIDLHGAPGSQNGYDNSGQKMTYPTWQTNQENVERTERCIETIASLAANSSAATVVAPLNEPAGYNGTQMLDVVHDYFTTAYNIIRHPNGQGLDSSIIVLIHDAFMNGTYWGDYLTAAEGTHDVVMDTHQYQVFVDSLLNLTLDEHLEYTCNNLSTAISQYELPIIVGEWTNAITDCGYWVNGRNQGARWDGTFAGDSAFNNSCAGLSRDASTFSSDYLTFLRKYWEAQVDTFETSYGWIQWAWKIEAGYSDEWSYKAGLQYGWIPQDPTERQYPDICASYSSPTSTSVTSVSSITSYASSASYPVISTSSPEVTAYKFAF